MKSVLVLLVAYLLLALPSPVGGQQATQPFARWKPPTFVVTADTLPAISGDYRYEGLAFGAVVLGALGAWIGSHHFESCTLEAGGGCGDSDNLVVQAVTLGLTGAALGGGLGYLVGRTSPKKARPDSVMFQTPKLATVPDSVRRIVGYQHWRGSAIGMAIGAGIGTLVAAVAPSDGCADCTDSWSRGRAMVTLGLLGAGSGAVVGFLAGLSSPKYVWEPGTP